MKTIDSQQADGAKLPDSSLAPVLRLAGLTKRFGEHAAVNDLSFNVEEGDIFGFLGPNGAGKSTTMYMIAGLVSPTSGAIELFGRPHGGDSSVRENMGTLIETPAFYEYLSGRKNLAILARVHGGISAGRLDEVLELVGLLPRGKDKVREYSHGMKQRLGIAQALLSRPRLLLLDEPTNGLDPDGSAQMWDLLRTLVREERMTVFISSHLLHEVEEGCNRIAVINQGILVACDQVRSLLFFHKEDSLLMFDTPEVRDDAEAVLRTLPGIELLASTEPAVLGEETATRIRMTQGMMSDIIGTLASKGCVPRAVIPQRKTLKQFFLELTRRQQ